MHNSTVIKRIRLAATRKNKNKRGEQFEFQMRFAQQLTQLGGHIDDLQQMIDEHRFVFHI